MRSRANLPRKIRLYVLRIRDFPFPNPWGFSILRLLRIFGRGSGFLGFGPKKYGVETDELPVHSEASKMFDIYELMVQKSGDHQLI